MTSASGATSWRAWLRGCCCFLLLLRLQIGRSGNWGANAGRHCIALRTSPPFAGSSIIGGSSRAECVRRLPSRWYWLYFCWLASLGRSVRESAGKRASLRQARLFFDAGEHVCFHGRRGKAARCSQQVFFIGSGRVEGELDLGKHPCLGLVLHEGL